MSRENPWIAPELPPPLGTRPTARRVASRAAPTGTVQARAYDRMATRLLGHFGARERTFQGICEALAEAGSDLVADGTLSDAQAQRLQEWLARDLEHLAAALVRGPRGAAADTRACATLSGGALAALLEVLDASGDGLFRAATHARGPGLRRAGEVTCAGAVSCTACGRTQRLAASTRLEPCRGCQGMAFTRSL